MSVVEVFKTAYIEVGIRDATILHTALLELEKENPYPKIESDEDKRKYQHNDKMVNIDDLPELTRDIGVISKALESWRLHIAREGTYPNEVKKEIRLTVRDTIIINDALKHLVKKNPYKPIEPNLSDPNPTVYQHHIPELYGKFKIVKEAMMSDILHGVHYEP